MADHGSNSSLDDGDSKRARPGPSLLDASLRKVLDGRIALRLFLDAIDSRHGVSSADVARAQLAIGTWKRQAESVRLLQCLINEISDDGPTDETLYAAKREVE